MPEHDVVLAVTSGTSKMGQIMQEAWDHLLPAIRNTDLPANSKAEAALRNRLVALTLPTIVGSDASPANEPKSGNYAIEKNELDIKSIAIDFEKRTLEISDATGKHKLSIGKQAWQRQRVPSVGAMVSRIPNSSDVGIATCGAWTSDNSFVVRTWLYESPFRVDVTLKFDGENVNVSLKRNVNFGPTTFAMSGKRIQD